MQSATYEIPATQTYLSYEHMIGSTEHAGAAAVHVSHVLHISHTWSLMRSEEQNRSTDDHTETLIPFSMNTTSERIPTNNKSNLYLHTLAP
jgi:hypothetical protein